MAVRRHVRARDVILKETREDRVLVWSFDVRSTSLLLSLAAAVVAAGFGAAVVVAIGDDGGPGENDLTGREDTRSPLPPECL